MSALGTLMTGLRQRFEVLPSNDRRALLLMFAAIGLTIVYLSLDSSRGYQQAAVLRYKDAMEDSRWITLNQGQIKAAAGTAAPVVAAGDASLINRATTSAKPFGIVFKRFQPEGETGLRLWIEGAEFDQLMRWLAALDKQQIRLDQLDVDKQGEQSGLVDVRVLLSL